jgi:phosphopantetheinyl transferase (holo-ACP synthase)
VAQVPNNRISSNIIYRFAAKEAAMKAYQSRRLTYQDIEILSPPQKYGRSGAPIAMIKPENGGWDNAQIIPMSISHDGGFATAVCMAYEKSPGAIFETAEEVMEDLPLKAAEQD